MNAEEIRKRARERLEAKRKDGLRAVAVPEWGDDAKIHFHLPPSLADVRRVLPVVTRDGDKQENMKLMLEDVVFGMAKDEDGERIWTDRADFDEVISFPILIRCSNEAGLMRGHQRGVRQWRREN